jgi:hypothetical protein
VDITTAPAGRDVQIGGPAHRIAVAGHHDCSRGDVSQRIGWVGHISKKVSTFALEGDGFRQIVTSADGKSLYVINNASAAVGEVDAANAKGLITDSTSRRPPLVGDLQ